MSFKHRQLDSDHMDNMIHQHINDRIDHAAWLYDQGKESEAQFVIDNAYEFAENIDREGQLLWLDRVEQ